MTVLPFGSLNYYSITVHFLARDGEGPGQEEAGGGEGWRGPRAGWYISSLQNSLLKGTTIS